MRRCCHSMRYEEHSDEKRLAYNANWTCRSHAFKKNIMKDDLIVEAVADGDNDAIRAILADVCSLTNMGFAAVARVTEDRWIACQVFDKIEFGLTPGGELEIATTICNEIREHGQAVVFDDDTVDPAWRSEETKPELQSLMHISN